jgi:hypothetical protein
MSPLPKIVALSETIYRKLLCLYPVAHRRDYAKPMAQLFRDQCRDAWSAGRSVGVIKLWLRVLPDLGKTSIVERVAAIERNPIMKYLNAKNSPTVLLVVGLAFGILSFSPFIMSHDLFMPVMIVTALSILAKAVVELFRPGTEWGRIAIRTLVLMVVFAVFMPAWAKLKMVGTIQHFGDPLDLFGIFIVSCLMINPVVTAIKLLQFLVQRRKG